MELKIEVRDVDVNLSPLKAGLMDVTFHLHAVEAGISPFEVKVTSEKRNVDDAIADCKQRLAELGAALQEEAGR